MNEETVARLIALPEKSAKRRAILTTFGCHSMATVMLRLMLACGEERPDLEAKVEEILNDPTLE